MFAYKNLVLTFMLTLSSIASAYSGIPLTFRRLITDCLGIYVVVDVTFSDNGAIHGELISIGLYYPCEDDPKSGGKLVPMTDPLPAGMTVEEFMKLLDAPNAEERAYLEKMAARAKPGNLQVYPNPTGAGKARYTLSVDNPQLLQSGAEGTMRVYSFGGQLIAEQRLSLAPTVEGQLELAPGTPSGEYTVLLESNGKIIATDILVVQ